MYGSEVGDEALFLRHTYLALFARLMAYVAITRSLPGGDLLARLVDGSEFGGLGLRNLVEEDFFAWVLEDGVRQDALTLLAGLGRHLLVYDLSRLSEDVLKELYQEMVDPEARHDLGEFYTPDWLAELTLREAGFTPEGDLLDPACGSGTFLFVAVRLAREQGLGGERLVRWATERLAGLDVHPLAVTIARVNFILALAQDLPVPGPITIPIYMADTLAQVERGLPQTIPVAVDLPRQERRSNMPLRFDLPVDLAVQPQRLDEAITALADFARQTGDEEAVSQGLRSRLQHIGLTQYQQDIFAENFRLLRHLVQRGRDTVYVFILRNAYRPELLARRGFSLVAGNPPWLSYRFIQRRDYQDRVRRLVFYYGLLDQRDVPLFTQMELATLFFAYCHDRFLREGGTIAFVMPRSVLTGAQQHRRFRQRFAPSKMLDLEEVKPLFNVPACVLIAPKDGAPSEPDFRRFSGSLPARNATWAEAQPHLTVQRAAMPVLPAGQHSPYRASVFQGATIVPRCFWFVRPPERALALDPDRPYLKTDPLIEPQAKPPWKGLRLEGSVEARFLYATLLGDDLVPFGWRRLRLVVLPVREEPGGRLALVDAGEALRQGWTGLADWLRRAEELWETHRSATTQASLLEWLNYQNKLTRQRPAPARLVYAGRGTYLVACVVHGDALAGVQGLAVRGYVSDHHAYEYATSNEDEAHYLSSLLNSTAVDEAIKSVQTRGAFGPRNIHRAPFDALPTPIPRYDARDERYRRLAELSRRCHERVAGMTLPQGRAIGRLRQEVRQALAGELAEIDRLARDLLGL